MSFDLEGLVHLPFDLEEVTLRVHEPRNGDEHASFAAGVDDVGLCSDRLSGIRRAPTAVGWRRHDG